MKTVVTVLLLLWATAGTGSCESLSGAFKYFYSATVSSQGGCAAPSNCLYGSAQDTQNSAAILTVKLCWDDPTFTSNCLSLTANKAENAWAGCSETCHGFQYIPSVTGGVDPNDGKRHFLYGKVISVVNPGPGDLLIAGTPFPFTYVSNSVAGPRYLPNTEKNPSRLQPGQFLVIANVLDPYSVGVAGAGVNPVCTVTWGRYPGQVLFDNGAAGYWMQQHGVPCDSAHVLLASLTVKQNLDISDAGIANLLTDYASVPASIQAGAIAWVQPSVITNNTVPASVDAARPVSVLLAMGGYVSNAGCNTSAAGLTGYGTAYFDSASAAPFTDAGIRPMMMLAAGACTHAGCADPADPSNAGYVWTASVPAWKAVVNNVMAALNSNPSGVSMDSTFTGNAQRSVINYSISGASLKSPGAIDPRIATFQILGTAAAPASSTLSPSLSNLLVFQNATVSYGFSSATQMPFAVGAGIAFNNTSYSGWLPGDGSQSTMLGYLSHGAAAVYGNAIEPYAIQAADKNINWEIFAGNYLQGQTVVEAMWKSVRFPCNGNFAGDPLAAPYSLPSPPSGHVSHYRPN